MKILMLSGDFYPTTSGGAYEDWEFARGAGQNHDVTVVTYLTSDTEREERTEGVDIYRPFKATPDGKHPNSLVGQISRLVFIFLLTPWLLKRIWLNDTPDVIYSTNHLMHPVGKIASVIFDVPLVSYIAYTPSINPSNHQITNPLYLIEQFNFKYCLGDRVLCRNSEIVDLLEANGYDATRIDGILAVKDFDEIEPRELESELEIPATSTAIITVARLVAIKNIGAAIASLAALPSSYHLIIVGEGEERAHLENAASFFDIEDRVHFLGQKPHDETLEYIMASDVLVISSIMESYPSVCFEALALNRPVVSTPVGVLPDLDDPRVKTTSTNGLSDEIRQVKTDQWDREIDEEVLEEFGISRFVSEVVRQLEDVA